MFAYVHLLALVPFLFILYHALHFVVDTTGLVNTLSAALASVTVVTGAQQCHPGLLSTAISAPATASAPTVPAPYATPIGISADISSWLNISASSQIIFSKNTMLSNINPDIPGTVNGTVVAAQSGPDFDNTVPDYEYSWVRDSALTLDVVCRLYAASTDQQTQSLYEDLLFQYATARAQEQNDPDLIAGLGEPKFYLNNTAFTGPWGRPQNDGPATSAITLLGFATSYIANGGSESRVISAIYDSTTNPSAPVKADLLYIAENWNVSCFDLWEEVDSVHFYTRVVQRRALLQGAAFATAINDSSTSAILTSAAASLTSTLSGFWNASGQQIDYEIGPVLHGKTSYKDTAVLLGILHGYASDGVYAYTNDQVLSSLLRITTSFLSVYPIASVTSDAAGLPLGIPVGRYPEDIYNGIATSPAGGNPWFLCTAAAAELLYRAAAEYASAGLINATATSLPFFAYFAPDAALVTDTVYAATTPQFAGATQALLGWADAFLRRVRYHAAAGGRLAEEYSRDTGFERGAAQLTWSHAAVVTAALARAEALGDAGYAEALADFTVR